MNLDLLRSFFAVVEHGSLNQAAERLRVSQSTLTRQMQALEQEIGGALLERGPGGVALTATGRLLLDRMKPLLTEFDAALGEVRKRARGKSSALRIGYMPSASARFLHPALSALRRTHPTIKVTLVDLSPGEQIEALREGGIDLAFLRDPGTFLRREFYVRRLASLPIIVALADTHPRAGEKAIRLEDLRTDLFVGAAESDLPGHNRWITRLCRVAGFRARFVGDSDSLAHGLAMVVSEGAVSLMPDYARTDGVPGVVFRPLKGCSVTLDLLVAWPRGRLSEPVRALLELLPQPPARAA